MPVITALLLDVDDTLIDTRAAMVAAGEAAVRELWPQLGAEAQHAAGVYLHADPHDYFGPFSRGEMSFAEMRRARIADLVRSFSLTAGEEINGRFEEAYAPAFAANVRLFDDVRPLLEDARSAGLPVGLLTNSSTSSTQLKLEITGLSHAFAVVTTTDTLGFGKPDARAFLHACSMLGSAPSETLFVGDHLEIDAVAATDAGLSAVWLQRHPGDSRDLGGARARARGIPVVTSLSQVPANWYYAAR